MPYIHPSLRPEMNEVVDFMIKKGVAPDGRLSYVLFKLCKKIVQPSYNNYKNYRAELKECAGEIKRRWMNPYEDKKKKQNGDVI